MGKNVSNNSTQDRPFLHPIRRMVWTRPVAKSLRQADEADNELDFMHARDFSLIL